MALRLLFITPTIDEQDDDLAFTSLWARTFFEAGYDVTVICGRKGETSLPFPVYGLGHDNKGGSKFKPIFRLLRLITTLKYDRVFVHMNTGYLAVGAWYWWLRRIPTYLWWTHYTRPRTFRMSEFVLKRLFAATKESLPQFDGDPRKVVTGHGIDTHFWNVPAVSDEAREPKEHLLAVHRISRSKRLELTIRALALLPPEYTLTHYGRPLNPADDLAYEKEMYALVKELGLESRVRFMGSVPMPQLCEIYPRYQTFINIVPKTIDKSVLEAMYCGLTPVLTSGQAEAIGGLSYPKNDTPEAIAEYIRTMRIMSHKELRQIVDERHSLKRLINVLSEYIQPGI